MRLSTRAALGLLTVPALAFASACAPTEKADDPSTGASPASCEVADLDLIKDGTLTIATDSPAYAPWFIDDDPTNGKGFESAVAYAVAEKMGFTKDQVTWVTVPFNNSYAPGEKKFDFDINQISISADRAKVVDFSAGYYSASQAVITMEDSAVKVASVSDLAGLKLGAQTGTTSLKAITDVIKPKTEPLIFDDTNAAKQALLNDQVDAIVADLPTAFYITAAEIEGSTILGQFQPETGGQEEFGLLFEKGSTLRSCADKALKELKDAGTLDELATTWLSTTVDVPVLK